MMTFFELRHSFSINRKKNVTMSEVAKFCGIPWTRMKRIETGETIPNALEVRRLAAFYKVKIDDIIAIADQTARNQALSETSQGSEDGQLEQATPISGAATASA